MYRYLVCGRWGRHKRSFAISAIDLDDAKEVATELVKFYASGTENYTTQTWRYGEITVEPVEADTPVLLLLRGGRAHLRLVK